MLKNTTKPGDPGKHSGKYRTDVLNGLKDKNEQLYNAVIKRLGDK